MFRATHESADGRYRLGVEGNRVFLYDEDDESGPIRDWPDSPAGRTAAVAFVTDLTGEDLLPVEAASKPVSAWTSWYLLPVVVLIAGGVTFLTERRDDMQCQSVDGLLARALDSGLDSQCTGDVDLYRLGVGLMVAGLVIALLIAVIRSTTRPKGVRTSRMTLMGWRIERAARQGGIACRDRRPQRYCRRCAARISSLRASSI